MKQYVRCKACGYIMEADKLSDKCPACGVSSKQFEPYDDKVSEKRRRLISLHIHPIIVHFPQAFAACLLLFAALLALTAGELRTAVFDAARVLAVLLPPSVAAAFGAGLFDAKLRFRRVTTPILVRKMILGGIFFLASCGAAAVVLFTGLDSPASLGAFAFFSLVCMGAGVKLGLLGAPLMVAKFPG